MKIRLAPNCFCKLIIFTNVGVPKILYRILKGVSMRMSSRETLTVAGDGAGLVLVCSASIFCLGQNPVVRLLSNICDNNKNPRT